MRDGIGRKSYLFPGNKPRKGRYRSRGEEYGNDVDNVTGFEIVGEASGGERKDFSLHSFECFGGVFGRFVEYSE